MTKILVVEDNDEIRELIVRELKRRKYEVLTANDGEQGIAKAKGENPALIIMDLNLPVLDGWQAMKHLKDDSKTKSIPIVALTAHTTSGDRDAGYAAGADAFISKPIMFTVLVERMEELLKKARK
jgi:CheY-like chemotaxis protein